MSYDEERHEPERFHVLWVDKLNKAISVRCKHQVRYRRGHVRPRLPYRLAKCLLSGVTEDKADGFARGWNAALAVSLGKK